MRTVPPGEDNNGILVSHYQRVNGCCLAPNEQFCLYIMACTTYLISLDDDNARFVLGQPIFALTP
jgi:hypothetical protein